MKIVNIILGLGTAIIVGALISLGIQAFHPAPVAPEYPNYYSTPTRSCDAGDTQCAAANKAIEDAQNQKQQQYNDAEQAFQNATKVYGRDVFIIANITGVVVFLAGFWLLFATIVAAQGVPIGIMMAGLWSIIYGYAAGWGSTNDQVKFFIGLVIAALVIGCSVWLIQRHEKNKEHALP